MNTKILKIVFVVILSLMLTGQAARAASMRGKLGVGTNWLGGQIRYSFTDLWMAELKGQIASDTRVGGLRLYRMFNNENTGIIPYVGGEFDWVLSKFIRGGYEGGGYCGLELPLTKHLGIGIDAGIYYVDVWGSLGKYADTGLIFNMGLTYYFFGENKNLTKRTKTKKAPSVKKTELIEAPKTDALEKASVPEEKPAIIIEKKKEVEIAEEKPAIAEKQKVIKKTSPKKTRRFSIK